MADITMCKGVGCDLKESCFRFTALANYLLQSYFSESPIENGNCDFYWEVKEEKTNNEKR